MAWIILMLGSIAFGYMLGTYMENRKQRIEEMQKLQQEMAEMPFASNVFKENQTNEYE